MRVSDIIDQVVFDAGEPGSDYRVAVRRWLNLARSYIADRARWRSAVDPLATLATETTNTTGLYQIDGYSMILGDVLYDQASTSVICYDSDVSLRMADPTKLIFGPPDVWSDAGTGPRGNRLIYLWPIPSDVRTIAFTGYRNLTDLSEASEQLTEDPFFGSITAWAACFVEGIAYYSEMHNREDITSKMSQKANFEREIARRMTTNRLTPTAALQQAILRFEGPKPTGRYPYIVTP